MRGTCEGAVLAAALAAGLVCAGPAGAAERFYGLTESSRVVSFNSDSPGAIRASKRITGTGGEKFVAIDVRPRTGGLYGLTTSNRLFKIGPRTGRTTAVASGPVGFALRSQAVGFDFNPTVDKIRVVSGAGQNARLDPDTGTLVDGDPDLAGVQPDRVLRYDANDRAANQSPRIGASAYTDNVAGATTTKLFGIDSGRDTLVAQAPPNDGVLRTVGRLGFNASGLFGFDIASNGLAYAAFTRPGAPTGLFRVNLSSGRATPATALNSVGTYTSRRRDPLRALAAAGRAPNDRTPPRVRYRKLNSPLINQLVRGAVLRLAVSCTEACDVTATFRLQNRVVGVGVGSVLGRRGEVLVRVKLTPSGKRLVSRVRPRVLQVRLAASDAAGNTVSSR